MQEWRKLFQRRAIPPRRLRAILWAKDTELLEFGAAGVLLSWALWLLLWAVLGHGDTITIHFLVLGRGFWGAVALCLASLQGYALIVGWPLMRRRSAFLGGCFWFGMLAMALWTAPYLTPVASTGVFALLEIFLYVRLRVVPPPDLTAAAGGDTGDGY